MNKLFLETSIQIKKIFGYKRDKILDFIKDKETVTSTYVLMEFNRRVIKDCIYLHSLLREERYVGDVIRRVNELPKEWERKRNICNLILGSISDGGDLENTERAAIKLKRFIDYQLKTHFLYGISTIIYETNCDLAKEDIIERNDKYFLNTTCKQAEMRCKIKNFIEDHKKEFEDILNGLKTESEFKKVCDVLEEVLNEPEKAMGKYCNKILGDCIISVEAPKDYKIFTTDHHYLAICRYIDRDTLLLNQLEF